MGFKKHNWMNLQRCGEMVELIIRDSNRRKIDSFVCNNNKDFNRVLKLVKKYGFTADKIQDEKSEVEEEIEFLNKEKEW